MVGRVLGTVLALVLVPAIPGWAAPSADPWPRWLASAPGSTRQVDHAPWTRLLGLYLRTPAGPGPSLFAYERVTPADRAALDGYLAALQDERVTQLNRQEQKAFWINLYNAATVRLVLAHYPLRSIRDLVPVLPLTPGPWTQKVVTVEGVPISLDEVEHRILRPGWKDPRVHYALNCASLGCPRLAPEAFTAANLEGRLDQGARDFVNSPQGVEFQGSELRLSSLYQWFAGDFGPGWEGVQSHLMSYALPGLRERLAEYRGPVRYRYDWALNDQAR